MTAASDDALAEAWNEGWKEGYRGGYVGPFGGDVEDVVANPYRVRQAVPNDPPAILCADMVDREYHLQRKTYGDRAVLMAPARMEWVAGMVFSRVELTMKAATMPDVTGELGQAHALLRARVRERP